MPYKPTKEDINWAISVLEMLKCGGYIAMPGTGSIYQVSHQTRTLTLVHTLDSCDDSKVFERSVIVFAELGYKVVKEDD